MKRENYGYGAFGEDLYQNQGKLQPFGYTGYQRDEIAETYYAQAREYQAEAGRFAGQDLIVGFAEYPETLNRYNYCWNNGVRLIDLTGLFPNETCQGRCGKEDTNQKENSRYHSCDRTYWNEDTFFYNEAFDKEIKGPSVDYNGLNIISVGCRMIKQGWQNDRGIWQWNTEINAVQVEAELGMSKEYMGFKADASAINFFGGGRFLKIGNQEYYIGLEIDLLALGATIGYSPEEQEGEIGISIGLGIKLKYKKREVEKSKEINSCEE